MTLQVESTIDEKLESLKKAKSIIIEAAHIYTDNQSNWEQQLKDAQLAAEITQLLQEKGKKVTSMLFVDDLHPKEHTLNLKNFLSEITLAGFEPDEIVNETSIVPKARKLVRKLLERNLARRKNDNSVYLKKGKRKIGLVTKEGKPTCNLLDATLYIQKLQKAEGTITILPRDWQKQQEKAIKVANAALPDTNTQLKIVNLFT
jgi:thioesterase domain-containing protein